MARGSTAKTRITERIKDAFGSDFVGIQDNKIYVWADDGGEKVQIAIAMTCPKVGIGAVSAPADFPETGTVAPVGSRTAEQTEAERQLVADMLARLGL